MARPIKRLEAQRSIRTLSRRRLQCIVRSKNCSCNVSGTAARRARRNVWLKKGSRPVSTLHVASNLLTKAMGTISSRSFSLGSFEFAHGTSTEPHHKIQDKEFFEKYLSGLVGEVFGEELMDKTKPDFYMVNFLRDDVLDEEGALVEEAPKVRGVGAAVVVRKLPCIEVKFKIAQDRPQIVFPI